MPSRETHALTTVLLANGKNGGRFLAVPVSCPMCESPNVELLGHTKPSVGGRSIGGVLRCLDCSAEEVLAIHLEPFNQQRVGLKEMIGRDPNRYKREAIRCGTVQGWRRHKRRGEDPCEPCREKRNAYNAENKRLNRERKAAEAAAETARVGAQSMPFQPGEDPAFGAWNRFAGREAS